MHSVATRVQGGTLAPANHGLRIQLGQAHGQQLGQHLTPLGGGYIG